jgi:hypothetical protein
MEKTNKKAYQKPIIIAPNTNPTLSTCSQNKSTSNSIRKLMQRRQRVLSRVMRRTTINLSLSRGRAEFIKDLGEKASLVDELNARLWDFERKLLAAESAAEAN